MPNKQKKSALNKNSAIEKITAVLKVQVCDATNDAQKTKALAHNDLSSKNEF